MKRLSSYAVLAAVAAAATLSSVPAKANLIPTLINVVPVGSEFLWSYGITVAPDQRIVSGPAPTTNPVPSDDTTFGSMITLYDFAGYVPGSCLGPVLWVCTDQAIGFTPDDVIPTDLAAFLNITYVYTTGPDIEGPFVGGFSLRSVYDLVTLIDYSGRGVKTGGPSDGTIAANVGQTAGPNVFDLEVGVPAPGALGLLALGLFGLTRRRSSPTIG